MSSDPGRAAALIVRAVDILETGGWCQKHFAVKANGKSTHPTKADAVAWCLTGALVKAQSEIVLLPHLYGGAVNDLTSFLIKRYEPITLVEYNDHDGRTKEQVLDLMRTYLEERA